MSGASYFPDNSSVVIQYSRFESNVGLYFGGSIHSDDRNHIIMIKSILSLNQAQNGGAVHVGSIASVINAGCSDCLFLFYMIAIQSIPNFNYKLSI